MNTLILTVILLIGAANADSLRTATVKRVIDGDTFVLTTGEKVRLIGVDTPELHHPRKPKGYFADSARAALQRFLGQGEVTLAFKGDRSDRYARLLCYVYVSDSLLINRELIAGGYAMAYLKYPHPLEAEFLEAELAARRKPSGMWKSP